MRKTEVMSPAGYWPQALAAVEAGADAVYFGMRHFSARAKVGFDLPEIAELMRMLHGRGVRGYVTFNTLVFEEELESAAESVGALAEAGVDALIVQDYAVVQLARRIAPDLELHASTQMSITNAEGVAMAARYGMQRVTLARELSLEEIHQIASRSACELEVFVHGALCVAYSGQCYSSEAWGGRSANRGQCAQACRLPYELLVDGQLKPLGEFRYLLSPEDLFALRQVPELVNAGVAALKIEGRYKDADYVAATTRAYREAVDAAWEERPQEVSPQTVLELEQVYSRGMGAHFLRGTDHQAVVNGRAPRHRGVCLGEVVAVARQEVHIRPDGNHKISPLKPGDGVVFDAASRRSPEEIEEGGRVYETAQGKDGNLVVRFANRAIDFTRIRAGDLLWRTHDPELSRRLSVIVAPAVPLARQPIALQVVAKEGQPLHMVWTLCRQRSIQARVESPEPLARAERNGATKELLEAQCGRLGNTPYVLEQLECDIEGDPFVPASLLNAMRREAVHRLQELQTNRNSPVVFPPGHVLAEMREKRTREANLSAPGVSHQNEASEKVPQIHLLVRTPQQLDAALSLQTDSVTLDYLDLYGLKPSVERVRQTGISVRVATPRILKPGEERVMDFLLRLECPLLVRAGGVLEGLRADVTRGGLLADFTGDFSLNIANAVAAQTYLDFGLARLTPGHDLNAVQILELGRQVDPARLELIAYQHLPVFHTEHCVFCRYLSKGTSYKDCGRPCESHVVSLRDEQGRAHPLLADVGCRNTVFGAEAQHGAKHLDAWLAGGFRHFRLEFAHETGEQLRAVVLAFQDAFRFWRRDGQFPAARSGRLTAALQRVAPEGITEGSLFVSQEQVMARRDLVPLDTLVPACTGGSPELQRETSVE
jgi:U32 family peptidase